MGISVLGRNSSDNYGASAPPPPPNPDPNNYVILDSDMVGKYLLVKIRYPDANNYEGVKILVYEGITLEKLQKQKTIDPHFSESKKYRSPIARFEPTEKGWEIARKFAAILTVVYE